MTFTVTDAARRWRCSQVTAEEFLSDFEAEGFVRRNPANEDTYTWSVTPAGLKIALVLAHADDREPVA